ncbi:MAG: nucleoside deaminase [Candidatus Aenigmatarchaeota archaeon]
MIHPSEKIMRERIAYTKRNSGKQIQPTGCFIIKENKIVSKALSSTQKSHDTTAHAEINAIRKLSKSRRNNSLKGYWIYSTQMPCPMCASAIVWSDAEGIIYGWNGKNGWIDVYFKKFNVRKIINMTKRKKIKVFGTFL